MKEEIKNYINAKAERIRPCKHKWEFLEKREIVSTVNPYYKWNQWTFRCKKCGEANIINNQ